MDATSIITSPQAVYLALIMGKLMPPRLGYLLGTMGAKVVSLMPALQLNQAVRANQWVVHDCQLSEAELNRKAHLVFRSMANCIYDYYHYRNTPEQTKKIILSHQTEPIRRHIKKRKGLLIAALHTSNFDLAFTSFCAENRVQILTVRNPHKGYGVQNKLRAQDKLNITPISIASFIQAKKELLSGGCVLTGIDRPGTNEKYRPSFFGCKSALPVGYLRLAIETNVPVVVMGCTTNPDRTYSLVSSELIYLRRYRDLYSEMIENSEVVLGYAENFIRQDPTQWAMIYRVWPDLQSLC